MRYYLEVIFPDGNRVSGNYPFEEVISRIATLEKYPEIKYKMEAIKND